MTNKCWKKATSEELKEAHETRSKALEQSKEEVKMVQDMLIDAKKRKAKAESLFKTVDHWVIVRRNKKKRLC